jgi:phage terminase Nu1 subunit (DNA packaging protein)
MGTLVVDKTQFAKMLDITPRHIQRLTADGVLERARDKDGKEVIGRYDLMTNIPLYVRYLRTQARLDDVSESKYVMLRNQKMAAENEQAELKLALLKNKVHRADDVEFILTNMFTAMKTNLISIPARVTRLLIGQTKFQVIYDLLSAEIGRALLELSQYDPAIFSRQNTAYLAAQGADPTSLNGDGGNEDENDDETEGDIALPE